jgi:hypothetical protein
MTKKIKLLAAVFAVSVLFICSNAKAQSVATGKFRFGIGVDGLLPLGNVSDLESFGVGITPRLQYGIGNNTALTFTSGFYHFFPKTIILPTSPLGGTGYSAKYKLDIVPVKVGIKQFISSDFYLGAEAGVGFEVEDGGGPAKLILSPAVGYASKHWDAGLRYEGFFGQSNNYGVLGLRIAYGFGL